MQRTVAGYPVRPLAIDLGGTALELLVVARLEDYVDGAELLRRDDLPEPPYWMHVWPGSRALARRVATTAAWRGKRVIDLGCGIGLAGLVAARRGAAVTLLDRDRQALRFARHNARANRCRVAALQSDLRRPALRGYFDACLVADSTYDPSLQEAVAAFLASHLAADGFAWCAESVRSIDAGLRRACARRGLETQEWEVRELEEGREIPVRVTEVRRR